MTSQIKRTPYFEYTIEELKPWRTHKVPVFQSRLTLYSIPEDLWEKYNLDTVVDKYYAEIWAEAK